MIRVLQRKFVFFAMLAVTILLVGMLGCINLFNLVLSEQQIHMKMDHLQADHVSPVPFAPPPGESQRGEQGHGRPRAEDMHLSSVFFTVRVAADGTTDKIDVSRSAAVTEDAAKAMLASVQSSGKTEGRQWGYYYRCAPMPNGDGELWVFLDISEQTSFVVRLLLLSSLIGAVCWLLMLLPVILLSGRAVRPIVANMERQKQFVTDAGHEIKTPLAIIQANVEAMELYQGENKWSRNIREQVTRLGGLMQNLLTLSRIDEYDRNIQREPLSFSALAEETLDMFSEAMQLRSLTVQRDIDPHVTIQGNRELLQRLCSILFDNAAKYASQGGTVVVTLRQFERGCQLFVENSFDSVPTCAAEKLFDRFYRADEARTQKHGGYGIGLSAARTIAQAHGGSITASYRDGNTVVFCVTIP